MDEVKHLLQRCQSPLGTAKDIKVTSGQRGTGVSHQPIWSLLHPSTSITQDLSAEPFVEEGDQQEVTSVPQLPGHGTCDTTAPTSMHSANPEAHPHLSAIPTSLWPEETGVTRGNGSLCTQLSAWGRYQVTKNLSKTLC